MRCNYSALLDAPGGSQSNFETIQNTEVTRVGVTCRVRARFTSRSRQILLDLVVSPDYSVRTCLQLCRSYELCYCLRKSGRNQQTLAFTRIIIYCEVAAEDTKQIAMLTLLKYIIESILPFFNFLFQILVLSSDQRSLDFFS